MTAKAGTWFEFGEGVGVLLGTAPIVCNVCGRTMPETGVRDGLCMEDGGEFIRLGAQ